MQGVHERQHKLFYETPLPDEKIERRESATKKINERVKECATKLQDTAL